MRLYFIYFVKLYTKNLLAILFGLSFAFASIDYFQHLQKLEGASNHKVLYIFYMWQEALGLLYPLAIIFALIMTKLYLVKNSTMGALHSFGYSKKRLSIPLILVGVVTYLSFLGLHTTEFSYAKDKAFMLLEKRANAHNVNNLFFKYNDTFVYIKKLDPIAKTIDDITIFKVKEHRIQYTINAPKAIFDGDKWTAQKATVKSLNYKDTKLQNYTIEYKDTIDTLYGYKPHIIVSLYEGKSLNIIDAYHTWRLLESQNLNSDKIRASFYDKAVVPIFAISLLVILFFKLPFHSRMMNTSGVIAGALASTFIIWGVFFGLSQISANGVLIPEFTAILPVLMLMSYAIYIYYTDESSI